MIPSAVVDLITLLLGIQFHGILFMEVQNVEACVYATVKCVSVFIYCM
jgi:hypothetical protein